MFRSFRTHALVLSILAGCPVAAHAQGNGTSVNYMGLVGLNTVPSARMDAEGTARIGVSTLDPHNHAFLGMQIAKPLYVNLRQSMEVSSVGGKPSMVYPGLDLKLRLKEEDRYVPEIAFGMNSALGHKRFSSEYLALSKRVYDFDFTAGIAWGRLAGAGHIANPFARLSSRFGEERDYASEDAASPSDWFTGKQIGFFGGVEYFTPVEGLSLKADFGGERYTGERAKFAFDAPAPWSIGINYAPKPWFGFSTAVVGGDKVMARLSFQDDVTGWSRKSYKETKPYDFSARGPDSTWPRLAGEMARSESLNMGKTRVNGTDFSGVLHLNDYTPSSMQIGRAARHLAANAGPEIGTITVIPVTGGLRGEAVSFSRRDLTQAMARHQGSPEEIWQGASFSNDTRSISQKGRTRKYKFIPELTFSLGEEETTHLYRASFIAEEKKEYARGLISGSSLRFNIADNLHRLYEFKSIDMKSVRGDADFFTVNRVNIDRAYLGWMKTIIPDFHFALTAGYLEEMYAGYGGEVLYRPFQSPFAVGAELWKAYKRDGLTPLAAGLLSDTAVTGLMNAYYQIPDTDVTAFASAGRFLGGDYGVSTGVQKQFSSGLKLKAYATITNSDDNDVFGGERNMIAGMQLSIPLGDLRFVPEGSEARLKTEPLGRDDGQRLDKPFSLYEVTEPMSYRHLARNWQGVLE